MYITMRMWEIVKRSRLTRPGPCIRDSYEDFNSRPRARSDCQVIGRC